MAFRPIEARSAYVTYRLHRDGERFTPGKSRRSRHQRRSGSPLETKSFPVAQNHLTTSNARSTYTCIGVAATEDADAQKVMAASWAAMTAHSDAVLVVL